MARAVSSAPLAPAAPNGRPLAQYPGASRGSLVDALMVLILLVGAVAVRFPYLAVVPRFRDETFNALVALRIYRGDLLPFTDHEPYISSLFNFIVAAGMLVIGPTIYAARIVVTGIGILTVGATYVLGREAGGPLVGLIAGLFMLANGIHIAPVGHVAFSGSITPLFTTIAFWLFQRAHSRSSGRTLVGASFVLGLALLTHPTVVAFLPGIAGWYLWRNLTAMRTRWPYLAMLAFVAALSPMIIYNIMSGGESIRYAIYTATERGDYAMGKSTALTAVSYLERQAQLWLMLHGTVGGAVDERKGVAGYVADPQLIASSALTIAGTLWAAFRHRYSLPLWLVGSFSVLFPIFDANHYDVEYDGRYVLPLLPVLYTGVGILAVDITRNTRRQSTGKVPMLAVPIGVAVMLLVLMVTPLRSLMRYYEQASRADPSNASLVAVVENVKAARRPGDIVLLDNNLNDRRVVNASERDEASRFRVLRYILEFDDVPFETPDVDATVFNSLIAEQQGAIIILSAGFDGRDTARLGNLIAEFRLQSLDGQPLRPPRPSDRFGVYRFDPQPADSGPSIP
jgi:4-amino-4-deoxy-L-arabinose transferase-like glycosyltransferase